MKIIFMFISLVVLTSINTKQLCTEKDLEKREKDTGVIFTGTVLQIYRLNATDISAIIIVKRILKGDPALQDNEVVVAGFAKPDMCDSQVKERDTRIFLVNESPFSHFKLSSSVLRINIENIERLESAIADLPYKRRPNITERPCETFYCLYGSECLVDEATQKAYCRCLQDSCPDVFAPVCGSDGITYANECMLRMASCSQQKRIYTLRHGDCEVRNPCEDKKCGFGAVCKASLDGRTAECVCSDKCSTYGDGFGSRAVCGTDGRDYVNRCELQRTSCSEMRVIDVKFEGMCDPCEDVECPSSQVCQLDSKRNAICKCNAVCSSDVSPVCGSDGRTYSNECALRVESCKSRKNTRMVHRGECSSGENPCEKLKCEAGQECEISTYGIASCQCPPTCESVMKPVCGTDGQTYHNDCELLRTACLQNRNMAIAYTGECGDTGLCHNYLCAFGAVCVLKNGQPGCECPTCTEEYKPLCGSDGMSYSHECKMRKEACEKRKEITIAYTGLCNTCSKTQCEYYAVCELDSAGQPVCICPQSCVKLEAKVCGNDGNTYQNECELRVAACTKKMHIIVASKGPCDYCINVHCKYGARCEDGNCVCPTDCPELFEPVCSSDGNSYPNDCEMRRVACTQTLELSVLFYGECEDITGSGAKATDSGSGTFACEDEPCRFGGICDYDSEGMPHCICSFDCPELRAPVCASDGKFYESECKMREESCRGQSRLTIVPKNRCQKRVEIPCDGDIPLMNPVTETDYLCGEGSDFKKCPPNSYCHKTSEFAKCCQKALMIKSCADSAHGCCPDGKTAAQGPEQAGCPSICNCNRYGSYSSTCDPLSQQCPCKPGVGGLRCDRCEPGFWGLHKISEGSSGCLPCACNLYGSVRDDCEQMTGRCVCKHGIHGMKCDICPPGTVLGQDGCMDASLAKAVTGSCEQLLCYYGAKCKEKDGEAQCICDFKCSGDDQEPVCGSDGNAYGSECQLRLFSCRYQKPIEVINASPCKKVTTIATTVTEPLTTTLSPVRRSTELRTTTETESEAEPEQTDQLPENIVYTARTDFITTTIAPTQPPIGTPFFSGNSYIEYPKLQAENRFSLEIELRTLADDGIILYNGQSASGHGDYVSLAVKDGFLEFRYNLGSGSAILRSLEKLQLGKFHRIVAKRYLKDGMLLVDGVEVTGQSAGKKKSLDLIENMFIGFIPVQHKQVLMNIGVSSGFVGCIRYLKISSTRIDFKDMSKVIKAEAIRECVEDSCFSMPCQHGASCAVSDETEFYCICPGNFSGRHCEYSMNPCASDPCAFGATCTALENEEFHCLCPSGSSGQYCEEVHTALDVPEMTVDFGGQSYLMFPTLTHVSQAFTLELWFMTRALNGLLLYNGQKATAAGDFVAVTLLNGFLHFTYNLGSGTANVSKPETLKSPEPITLGIWHSVKMERIKRQGTLQIDNGPPVFGESSSPMWELNLAQPFYIGGVPDFSILKKTLSVQQGLDGAVQRLIVNSEDWEDLLARSIKRHRVGPYAGPPCLSDTCENGGRCLPLLDNFKCLCVANFTGKNCEEAIPQVVNDYNSDGPVAFDGSTFMKFSHLRHGNRNKGQRENDILLKFRTYTPNGMLVWTNKGFTVHGDFLAVVIVDGHVELSFNLGKQIQPMVLRSVERVDDNEWHTVQVKRYKRRGVLIVDENPPVENTSEPGATELNTDGFIWIGGSSTIPPGLPSAFYEGFQGCIGSITVDGEILHIYNTDTEQFLFCGAS